MRSSVDGRRAASGDLLAAAVAELQAHRDGLARQLQSIDAALAALHPPARGGARPSPVPSSGGTYRPGSLKDRIERVLARAGRPLRVVEIAAAVRGSGFATKSRRFAKKVNMALLEMKNVTRVEHGVYGLR